MIVDLFGSDHNATYPDVLAGLQSLGYDINKIKVLIHQFVTIMKDGEIIKMSTRKANYITLDELVDEVGKDVVRYFFNMRNITSHMNFDLTLAKNNLMKILFLSSICSRTDLFNHQNGYKRKSSAGLQ